MEHAKLENAVQLKSQYIQQLEEELGAIKKQYGESQWYLGEEKARREQSDSALKNSVTRCQDLESQLDKLREQLQKTQRELEATQWYLGEERAKQKQPQCY